MVRVACQQPITLTTDRVAYKVHPRPAEILHKLVFADPDNTEARQLQADAYEQMGYQAEGPQWRASS
jgi:alkyl sulfatase BDS1-like metallo-beta-lactamase superfamily hydrolase